MARKKRYSPSAIDAIGTPQYPKPRRLQPYTHVGAAGPPVGPNPLEALSQNLLRFNQGGIRAALGYNAAGQQAAIDALPELRSTVTKTGIGMSAYADKHGIARKGLPHVMGAASEEAGVQEATTDLDILFSSQGWTDKLTELKDIDKSEDFIAAIQKYAWESRPKREDKDSKVVTENFETGHAAAYLHGIENRQEVDKARQAWQNRKDNKDRIANITVMRGVLTDGFTKFTETDFTRDEEGAVIPENKRAAYKKKKLQESLKPIVETYTAKSHLWPTGNGISFSQDVFNTAWIPVLKGAVNDINVDVDLLQEWVEGLIKVRRPTYAMLTNEQGVQTGERSEVPTGSTSIVGGLKEEAEALLEGLYDQQSTRRNNLLTQSKNDAAHFGNNVLWPIMDNFQNNTWSAEEEAKFAAVGITKVSDINHKNFNDFINIAVEVPEFAKLLDSPEADRVLQESRLVILDSVKLKMQQLFVAGEKAGDDADIEMEQQLQGRVMEDQYLRILMPQFKSIFRQMVYDHKNPSSMFETFIKDNMLDVMYRQNNPGHTIEGEKLMAVMKGWMEGHFMTGAENYGVQMGYQKLGQIQEHYKDFGQIPKGAAAELIAIRTQVYGGDDKELDKDIGSMLELIKRQQEGEAKFHASISPEKHIISNVFGQAAGHGTYMDADSSEAQFPFYKQIIEPNIHRLTQLEQEQDDAARTGDGVDKDWALGVNTVRKGPAVKSFNWLVRHISRKKTELIDAWQADQDSDIGERKTAWEAGGREKVVQELLQFFGSRAFQDKMWEFHTTQSADEDTSSKTGVGEPPAIVAGDSRSKEAEAQLVSVAEHQLADAHGILEELSHVDIGQLKAVEDEDGSHGSVAVQMYAGQRGDKMAANGAKARLMYAEQEKAIVEDIITTAKDIETKGNTPEHNVDTLKAARVKLQALKDYYRDSHMKSTGVNWEEMVDDKLNPLEAVFTVGEGDYTVDIKVNAKHLDTRKHQIFPTWSSINEMTSIYDEWEIAHSMGVAEDMEPAALTKLMKYVTLLRTSRMNLDLMPLENGEINEDTRQTNIGRYREEVLGPQRKIKLSLDVSDLPADTNVSIKRRLMKNFYQSPGWPKGKILPAPSGKNFMFQGKEYTPAQAGHVKNAEDNNIDIATKGYNVKDGFTLPIFWQMYSGVSGPTINTEHTWEEPLSLDTKVGDWGDLTKHDVRKGKLDLEGKSAEDLANNTAWKQAVATELTLAAMNIPNPIGEAYKMNPWHLQFQTTRSRLWGGSDPRQKTLTTRKKKVRGDAWNPSGAKRGWPDKGEPTKTFLGFPYKSFNDNETNTYRSLDWDETYHKYFQLLSGGSMRMDKDHLPLTKAYYDQEVTDRNLDASSSELAEAYNMLVRMSAATDKNPSEDTRNDYSPYLGDFKVFPMPVPPKPWDFDTTKFQPSPTLPKMDRLKDTKTKVPVSSTRGGVKPKEKKE